MDLLLLLIDFVLVYWLAFTAGKMKAAIDIEKMDSKPIPKSFYFWIVINTLMAFWLMISIYGRGISRGSL